MQNLEIQRLYPSQRFIWNLIPPASGGGKLAAGRRRQAKRCPDVHVGEFLLLTVWDMAWFATVLLPLGANLCFKQVERVQR